MIWLKTVDYWHHQDNQVTANLSCLSKRSLQKIRFSHTHNTRTWVIGNTIIGTNGLFFFFFNILRSKVTHFTAFFFEVPQHNRKGRGIAEFIMLFQCGSLSTWGNDTPGLCLEPCSYCDDNTHERKTKMVCSPGRARKSFASSDFS